MESRSPKKRKRSCLPRFRAAALRRSAYQRSRSLRASALSPNYIAGLTLLGGDPMEPENQRALLPFVRKVRERLPEKNIWCYTGYTYANGAIEEEQANCEVTKELISLFDVLVDGRFVEELKDIRLKFRGSSNQRVIDVKRSLEVGNVVLYLT